MTFAVSPGIQDTEIDLTTVVPSVATTTGAAAGVFRWGPVNTPVLVSDENDLVKRFAKPTSLNAETFFSAASFLAYTSKLYVSRAGDTVMRNALANTGTVTDSSIFTIKSVSEYETKLEAGTFANDTDVKFVAKWPGAIGNALQVSVVSTAEAFSSTVNLAPTATISSSVAQTSLTINVNSSTATVRVANSATGTVADANTAATAAFNQLSVGDVITIGNSSIGTQQLKITSISAVSTNSTHASFTVQFNGRNTLKDNFSAVTFPREWEYKNSVQKAPGVSYHQANFATDSTVVDEMHVVVADRTGALSGAPGTVLQVFQGLSRNSQAKSEDGSNIYYRTVLANVSDWLWAVNDIDGAASGNNASLAASTNTKPTRIVFAGGLDTADEATIPVASVATAFDAFASAEQIDVSLMIAGKARNGAQLSNYLIDNIAEKRRDLVVFISPEREDVVNVPGQELDSIVGFRNSVRGSSYAVMDSGYKYMYDRYNDLYRWIPLNGDIAGLCARTDAVRDPWWSPAGHNRGQIRNCIRLAFNPAAEAQRDVLYQADVNPVMLVPGEGHLLYGDKTLLGRESSFSRINVRRLFIVLRKAIKRASKAQLFELNDEFTQATFRNMVEPYLRDIQGRRGLEEFKVVCDGSNNTAEVVNGNRFVGDVYVKPPRSINFIQLNFVAVRSGVEFTEIVGSF